MKTVLIAMAAALSLLVISLLPACASRNEAPDPIKIQEQIAEYRLQELELVRQTVLDDERADRLIHLISERDKLIASIAKEVGAYRTQISELNADYNADRKSFDVLIANNNSRRAVVRTELVDLIGAMKRETTAEEWKAISKFQVKRLNLRSLAYSQTDAGE